MTENILITVSVINNNDKQVVMEGHLVIRNAALIKEELVSVLNSSKNVTLILKNIIKIDLPGLQLLIALQKTAAVQGKKVLFDNEFADNIKSRLYKSDLNKIFLPESKSLLNGIH